MTEAEPGGPEDENTDERSRRSCSWCGRVEVDGAWVERALAPKAEGRGGHSVCPDCFESLLNQ